MYAAMKQALAADHVYKKHADLGGYVLVRPVAYFQVDEGATEGDAGECICL